MKKTYQNPEINIVKIETTQMIAQSDFENRLGTSSVGGNGSNALGRQGSSWDDDEE